MPDNAFLEDLPNAGEEASAMTIQRWGGLASFLMVVAFVGAHLIYFTGNLRDALGPFSYSLADFLYGMVWGACLVIAVYALRARVGGRAPRLMTFALLLALLAAGAFLAVASIRSANRYYHLAHPDLNLQTSATVLIVWTTLVSGVIGAAWHFLGWAFVLIGWAGWTSQRLPRLLSGLYLLGGLVSLSVFLFPPMEGNALVLALVTGIWQGIVLWKAEPEESQSPAINASPPAQA